MADIFSAAHLKITTWLLNPRLGVTEQSVLWFWLFYNTFGSIYMEMMHRPEKAR